VNQSAKRHLWIGGLIFLGAATVSAQPRTIDAAKSKLTIRVAKAGALSVLGHDHEITAPVTSGTVDVQGRKVELRVKTASLQVADAKASDKDRGEIQKTMIGVEVLDAEHNPEITFASTSVEETGAGAWQVHGNLTLHGQSQPVTVAVRREGERYVGSANLKQTSFGIKPVKVAGGSIRVKDEVRVEFDIQLAN
jgi:polyisoprenoid-binding protein YceI